MPNIIVGTAGHIDHGKSALVKALTGTDPDRLKEEKERGITIDIGFASLRLDRETTLGFIDVPGHERFIKNMLAGVGGIDLVMLVVAADEGVMPQTREHLDICSLLRIQRGLVVLTKIDVTDPDLVDLAEVEVREFLKGSFLEEAPLLRASAQTSHGIPELAASLAAAAASTPPRDASQVFRLPVDRCFTMKGFGTVVSGTLVSGSLHRDEEVEVLPPQLPARIRGIQVHGAAVHEARAGQRTAVNLQRVELSQVERGMVVVPPGLFQASQAFDVHVELLASAPAAVVRRKRVRVHVGTAEVIGHLVLLGRETLEPGQSAYAQILLERPALALPGDRFIVRQYSPMTTIGGGEILDARPARHRRSDAAAAERLRTLHGASLETRLATFVAGAGSQAMELSELIGRTGIAEPQIRLALMSLVRGGALQILADSPMVVVASDVLDRAMRALTEAVVRFHAAEPLSKGIGREDLKARALRGASPAVFRGALDRLVKARQLAVDQEFVHVFDRAVVLGGEEQRIRQLLEERYRDLGLQAPAADDVIAGLKVERQTAKKILQLMVKDNVLVKISETTPIDRNTLQKLIADVRALKSSQATFGVKEFKDLTGLSRKFAMPLLEYLDSQRVTRRVGDERIIL